MAEYADREHYIPVHRGELVDLLARELPHAERDKFRAFSRLLASTVHFEYHELLEKLKTAYAPFDPDAHAKSLRKRPADELRKDLDDLDREFGLLMGRAGYRAVGRQEVGVTAETALGIQVGVDLKQFERMAVFVRGNTVERRTVRRAANLWRLEDKQVPLFQRVVMILKLRPSRKVSARVATDKVYVQIFKNIPRADLAMLLPGAHVRFSSIDRGKVGFPLVTGLALGAWKILTGLAEDFAGLLSFAHPLAVWGVASGTVGYSAKSYFGYQQTRQRYQLDLTQVLYFQNLDTNGGVFFRILDEAEEQEGREALLAYYFLWRHAGEAGWAAEALDDYIEIDLERRIELKVDFDVAKALARLVERRVVRRVGDRFAAVPVEKALEMLDHTWDNYFKFNNPEYEAPPVA